MTVRYELHPLAKVEMMEAAVYYKQRRKGFGRLFIASIQKAIDEIIEQPEAASPVGSGVRKKIVSRFPYNGLYQMDAGVIRIIAVAHQKRTETYWEDRL